MNDVKIGLLGAAGRMGAALVRRIAATPGATLAAAAEAADHPAAGSEAGGFGIVIGTDPRAVFDACDVAIEFSLPPATAAHAALAAETGTAHVVGTTPASTLRRRRRCARRRRARPSSRRPI